MSTVVYDVGYDTRMTKTRKNMVTDIDRPKISRFRNTLKYLSSEYLNLRHTIPLTISSATTVPNLF